MLSRYDAISRRTDRKSAVMEVLEINLIMETQTMATQTTTFTAPMIPEFSSITPEGAKHWWNQMLALGLYINPDDGAENHINTETGKRLLDDAAAQKVDAIYDKMFSALGDEQTFDIGVTAWRQHQGETWNEDKQEWVNNS